MPEAPDLSPEELCQLQRDDNSLSRARAIAGGTPSAAAGEEFFYQEGLLYRWYRPTGIEGEAQKIEQLVLPWQLRPAVLKLAHDILLAGHSRVVQNVWSVPEFIDTGSEEGASDPTADH